MNHSKLKILSYVTALRPYQWVKNLLLFFPVVVSVQPFSTDMFKTLCISFIAFCLVASSGYLFNDLLDLEVDRNHPDKKTRPLAAGQISVFYSKVLIFVLTVIAFFDRISFCEYKIFPNFIRLFLTNSNLFFIFKT